jgi:hypothetical protein
VKNIFGPDSGSFNFQENDHDHHKRTHARTNGKRGAPNVRDGDAEDDINVK